MFTLNALTLSSEPEIVTDRATRPILLLGRETEGFSRTSDHQDPEPEVSCLDSGLSPASPRDSAPHM